MKLAAMCVVSMLTAGTIAFGMLRDEPTRFQKGVPGRIVALKAGTPATITISLEEFGTLLNLDISAKARIWTAFEQGKLSDLNQGQFVSLRLGDDHRTVHEIHVQGPIREASIKSIAPSGKILIIEDDNDDHDAVQQPKGVDLAPDAILRIGGLPATRADLKPGMRVPLEFDREGNRVNAIEAEASENSLIVGTLLEIHPDDHTIVVDRGDDDDNDQPDRQSFMINSDTIITLDGKPAKQADIRRGSAVVLRLYEDGAEVRLIQATSPAADDDEM